jgi:ribosomal protein S27E
MACMFVHHSQYVVLMLTRASTADGHFMQLRFPSCVTAQIVFGKSQLVTCLLDNE